MDQELKHEILSLIKENLNQDSIEIGNSKTGVVKVYCDFSDIEASERKLMNAIIILKRNRVEVLE
jgi:hypothetical protein